METIVNDANGKRIIVGARINVWNWAENEFPHGEVISITDLDGDVDDEGRPFGINPKIEVKWPDYEDTEWFHASWDATGPWDEDAPYSCEDLEIVHA